GLAETCWGGGNFASDRHSAGPRRAREGGALLGVSAPGGGGVRPLRRASAVADHGGRRAGTVGLPGRRRRTRPAAGDDPCRCRRTAAWRRRTDDRSTTGIRRAVRPSSLARTGARVCGRRTRHTEKETRDRD